MVEDEKQSIYKFRLAMPEIFMEKYGKYSVLDLTDTGEINKEQRIDLDKNFRSRRVVLDSVNAVFEQIMMEPVGGIAYDSAAALKYGELFEETLNQDLTNELTTETKQNQQFTQFGTPLDYTDNKNLPDNIKNRIAGNVELLLVTEEDLMRKLFAAKIPVGKGNRQ
jgi:ATP-dependent exoDNAse (exonuclease V) beta subunit